MKTSTSDDNTSNVVDFFTGQPFSERANRRFIRLSPELDGLEMLYSNETSDDKLFSLKILAWGLRANGEVVGLVPWLDQLMAAVEINDPLNGHFEGYYDPGIDEIFFDAPIHKIVELETAAEYYDCQCDDPEEVLQEIPDTIGTHAVISTNGFQSITLTEVVSWRLLFDGSLDGMLADPTKVLSTPVLPGDDCLYSAHSRDGFKYFFQHQIANKLKAKDPEALAAISCLMDGR